MRKQKMKDIQREQEKHNKDQMRKAKQEHHQLEQDKKLSEIA